MVLNPEERKILRPWVLTNQQRNLRKMAFRRRRLGSRTDLNSANMPPIHRRLAGEPQCYSKSPLSRRTMVGYNNFSVEFARPGLE